MDSRRFLNICDRQTVVYHHFISMYYQLHIVLPNICASVHFPYGSTTSWPYFRFIAFSKILSDFCSKELNPNTHFIGFYLQPIHYLSSKSAHKYMCGRKEEPLYFFILFFFFQMIFVVILLFIFIFRRGTDQ